MAWSVNLALTVVTLVSAFVLGILLKRDNKRMDDLDAAGYALEEGIDDKAQISTAEAAVRTAGRRLGGTQAGKTARYQV